MKKIIDQLKDSMIKNGLFIKLFSVTVISIVLVSTLITISTIQVSTDLFLGTFSITNSNIIRQITSQFNSYSATVAATVNEVENNGVLKRVLDDEDLDSLSLASNYYQVNQQLERIYTNLQPFDANLIVYGSNHQLFNMNYIYWPVSKPYVESLAITEKTLDPPHTLNYYSIETDVIKDDQIVVATKALTERSTDHVYGIVYISLRESQLRAFYEGYTHEGNDIALINQAGQIISSSRKDLVGTESMDLLEIAHSMDINEVDPIEVELWDKDYLLLTEYLPGFDMYLVNLIDRQMIVRSLIDTEEILLISLIIILFALGLVWIVTRRITKSLTRLVKKISRIAKYNFSERISEDGGYESRQIAKAFNNTLDELETYIAIVVESQKKQKNAELQSLQHQINPHFLYNTLTTVKFMVMQSDPEQAMTSIHALITLLKNTLGEVSETVTVEKELENTKNYVTINQARYGEDIKVNYFVALDCLDYHVPKLVLQPFIENAFFHAFNQKKGGFIQILIQQNDGHLSCEVVDDGDGMAMEKGKFKQKRQHFSGIGMKNVHERIQLMYGDSFGVDVSSELGKGTKVTIKLPAIKEET